MIRPNRSWFSAPVFPTVIALGAVLLGLPVLKLVLLGLIAAGGTVICALFLTQRHSSSVLVNWKKEVRTLQKTVDHIKNKAVMRSGNEICTELRQCEGILPFLSEPARREISDYYLSAFQRYFTAYRTFEECGAEDRFIEEAMQKTETTIDEISRNFRKVCDRNGENASMRMTAEHEVLRKKLNH